MHALTIWMEAALAEAVSEGLLEDGEALSVTVEDADAGTATERPVFDEPAAGDSDGWLRAKVTALFEDEAGARRAEDDLRRGGAGIERTTVDVLEARDWVRATQAEFTPVDCGHGLWIVPGWHEPPADARTVVRLDPGMAFGTGTHPTTRLCLSFLARRGAGTAWPRLLDYGTGSGILAIAAAKLGATEVDAVDIDAAAVDTARANAIGNGVAIRTGRPDLAAGRYGLVVANILARPLVVLAPLLAEHLDEGGELILAGLLASQVDELAAAYAPWLALAPIGEDDGWALLHGRRWTQGGARVA